MKFIQLFFLLFFFSITAAKSQNLVADVTNNYSLSVICKVQDVVTAANIAQSEQVPLANFFQNAETSIANAVNSNATSTQLEAIQVQLIPQFQAILSAQELALYTTNRPGSVYALPPPIHTSSN